ncbi:MAG: 3-phosphoshikimate 1-carboxyvinyltransferase, partial [Calditrichaeota bacterium]
MSAQPSHLLIHPGILKGRISAPPSKSISHRLLIMGALSGENCTINNILMSEDIEITLNALAGMGFQWILNKNQVNFTGNRIVPEKEVRIFLGNSGTTARLLAAIAAAIPGKYHFSGTKRLQERPMQPLLKALENLGADIRHNRGFLPLQVSGKQLNGGKIEIDASVSSQFISGLMMMAPLMQRGLEILPINSAVSVPYIKLTINLMKQAGITVQEQDPLIIIPGQQKFELGKCRVEGDYSSASYFAVGAAISGGDVLIENLNRHSVQGDRKILSILAEAGADISWQNSAVRISARRLNGIDTDMKDVPDIVPS